MSYCKSLIGQKFNRLTVIKRLPNDKKNSVWLCKCECGNTHAVRRGNLTSNNVKSCGCLLKEAKPPPPRGRDKNYKYLLKPFKRFGYLYCYLPTHPNAFKSGCIAEHVIIMSKYLKRSLKKGEVVHHKNGIKHDNRLSNLELWSHAHPSGQRVSDMVDFCTKYLREYAPDNLISNLR